MILHGIGIYKYTFIFRFEENAGINYSHIRHL